MAGIACQVGVDATDRRYWPAEHPGQIGLAHRAPPKLIGQIRVRPRVLGHDHHPGGVHVQSVDDAGSSRLVEAFAERSDMMQQRVHQRTAVIVQVETAEGVNNIEEIAAVDGVDVVFVGPLDLSYNLGCPKQFEHPDLLAALQKVVHACQDAGTAVGILSSEDKANQHLDEGFTFLAVGSDAGAAKHGLQRLRDA